MPPGAFSFVGCRMKEPLNPAGAEVGPTLGSAMQSRHGVGLRNEHFPAIVAGEARGRVGFFEIISENFLVPGGRPLAVLDKVRKDFPILMHGVSLSIGGSDRLNLSYLKDLRALAHRVQPEWVSDHLCWGTAA